MHAGRDLSLEIVPEPLRGPVNAYSCGVGVGAGVGVGVGMGVAVGVGVGVGIRVGVGSSVQALMMMARLSNTAVRMAVLNRSSDRAPELEKSRCKPQGSNSHGSEDGDSL